MGTPRREVRRAPQGGASQAEPSPWEETAAWRAEGGRVGMGLCVGSRGGPCGPSVAAGGGVGGRGRKGAPWSDGWAQAGVSSGGRLEPVTTAPASPESVLPEAPGWLGLHRLEDRD